MAEMARRGRELISGAFEDPSEEDTSTGATGADPTRPHSRQIEKDEVLDAKENRYVFMSRLAVLLVLIVSALCISLAVYFYLADIEHKEFVNQFRSDADKVLETIGSGLDNTLGPADAFVIKLVSHARATNETWPFVTMPHFSIQAAKLLRLSKAILVRIMYFIPPEQRDEWEEFAYNNHKGWVEEGLELQRNDPENTRPVPPEYRVSRSIYGVDGPKEHPEPDYGMYLPDWQENPIIPGPREGTGVYNWDGLTQSLDARARWRAKESKSAVVSEYLNNQKDLSDSIALKKAQSRWAFIKSILPPGQDEKEPLSQIEYPIIDKLDELRVDHDSIVKNASLPVVGLLSFNLRWVELIRNILPSHSIGLVVVFQQVGCGEPFTYRLDGPEATYLGIGDLSDPAYDQLKVSSLLSDLTGITLTSSLGNNSRSAYTGLPLDDEFCPKRITVYPSADMEDGFKSNTPAVLASVAALILVFTSLVFVAYDRLVARRQRLLMNRAIASGLIVSELFPETVKKQLYEERELEQKQKARQAKFLAANLPSMRSSGDNDDSSAPGLPMDQTESVRPSAIASRYQETSVFLADLAGFTAWSRQRSPEQVFDFLETIYGAFDAQAARRHVCKIETIGDCYVAVTGIPNEQKDHALRITRFARDCINVMDRITFSLACQFGDDTQLLRLRVGINSGPTTAGVLRGDKARFQLFGDTINTASRMETHGEPGRIHVSESTAEELRNSGKEHWLTKREDKIVAKGKGELTTYWVTLRNSVPTKSAVSSDASPPLPQPPLREHSSAAPPPPPPPRNYDSTDGLCEILEAADYDNDGITPTTCSSHSGAEEEEDVAKLKEKLFQRLDV